MTDDKLKVDLEALEKLSPELKKLATNLTNKAASPPKVEDGDTPTMEAIRRLATQTMPSVQRAFAGRCANLADLSMQTKNGFGDTEEHVTQLIQSVAGLSRGGRG